MKKFLTLLIFLSSICLVGIAETDIYSISDEQIQAQQQQVAEVALALGFGEEVVVPVGVYMFETHIPIGHWRVVVESGDEAIISGGRELYESGKRIRVTTNECFRISVPNHDSPMYSNYVKMPFYLTVDSPIYFIVEKEPIRMIRVESNPYLDWLF